MISVIVATYNQERTIGRTLDSILMQQCHEPIEIIIGEDSSTDGTLSVCREYQKQHPNVIRIMANHPNKGLQDNYFDCLLACRGEYIADCAGDDFWIDPKKLEKQLTVLEADSSVTLVHTAWNYYDEDSGMAVKATPPHPYTDITEGKDMLTAIITQTRFPVVHLCSSLYRRDVVMQAYREDENLFRNSKYGCEDLQIICALAAQGRVAFLPDVTLNYSVNHTSISNAASETKQFSFVSKATQLSHDLANKYHTNGKTVDTYFSYRIYALSMHAFRAHSKVLRDETRRLKKTWNAKPSLLYCLVQTVMSNELFWRMGLMLRALVMKFKK